MKNSFTIFSRSFTLFSVIILLMSLGVYLWLPGWQITPAFPYIVLFFYALSLVIFRLLDRTRQQKISRFANTYMLVNFGKLIFFTLVVIAYALTFRDDAVSFIITFFIYYLLFTTFEVIALLKGNQQD